MAQLLRLKRYSKVVSLSASYSTTFSASLKTTLESIRPCNRCQILRQNTTGNIATEREVGHRYSSGVAHAKSDHPHNLSKAPWKKKKKKNSSINKKIHSDLLKVLNRRAVQLVFSREANQMHRALVTNFSFIDFPLQNSVDSIDLKQLYGAQDASSKNSGFNYSSVHQPEGNIQPVSPENSWQAQVSSFEKQMEAQAQSPHGSKPGLSAAAWAEANLPDSGAGVIRNRDAKLTGSGISNTQQPPHSGPANTVQAMLSDALNPLPENGPRQRDFDQTLLDRDTAHSANSPIPSSSSSSVVPELTKTQRDFDQNLINIATAHSANSSNPSSSVVPESIKTQRNFDQSLINLETHHSANSSLVPELIITKSTKPSVSVNANIVKPKQVGKAAKKGVSSLAAEDAAAGPRKTAGEATVQKSLSKLEMRQLSRAQSEKQKFQSDPAKFNHIFNQELLAYVDACCFAGLESMAYSMLKLTKMQRDANEEKMTAGMQQVQDINIFNRLLLALAKKCQLGQIREVFSLMREEGLRPNMQSYAAVWECLGRHQDMPLDVGLKVMEDMEREDLDIKELFNKAVFFQDEQQVIFQAIRAVDPDYLPYRALQPQPPSGPLVDNLETSTPLDQMVERNPYADVLDADRVQALCDTQMQRELRSTVTVESILKQPPPGRRTLDYRKKLDRVREDWKGMLTKAFEKKVRYMARKNKMEYGITMYPYLKLFDTHDYVQCLLQEVEDLTAASETFSPNKTFLWKRLSQRIYTKFVMADKIKNKVPKKVSALYSEYLIHFLDKDLDLASHRQLWQSLMLNSPEGPSLDVPEKIWPSHVSLALGKLLYELIIYDLKVDTNMLKASTSLGRNMVPAFYTIYRNYSYQTFEEIKPHPVLVKLQRGAELSELSFEAGFLPMLVPPVPWISTTHGGYLLNAVRLVRIPMQAQAQTEKVQETVATSQLSTVLDSINTLSACAWKINHRILDIIIDVFNKKGDASLDIPPPVSECPQPPRITQGMSAQERSVAHRRRQKLRTQRSEMYSLWCQELYKLSIASKFRDEVFWFPHNLDFRGRTYPCPPHFNHLGSDITRSILLFAKAKPLGPQGLDWMKIHLVNLTGFKKRSPNRERLVYANEVMDEIVDSADNPMTGRKWWQKSDEPWQTLACCMEITNAMRSPDPEQYVCNLPIHQDGSCNGLQHYAALGRDKAGAQSVNLWPFDHPQDVYSDVCELVEKERQKDAAKGVEIAQHLEGFVRRKVIKQTVMTTVYGVTRYGAKAQILRQLKDIPEFPQSHVWGACIYLTDKTFQSLNEMFSATKDIQSQVWGACIYLTDETFQSLKEMFSATKDIPDWLTLTAQLISTVCQRPVEWVTPVGLTVVQPYHKSMALLRFGVSSTDSWNYFQKPNAMKQKNAFPPNFIHSLDSTHMMLTALYCMRAGITFVSVHDCFWTHACDIEIMSKICREQFVALHTQPILEDLSRQLIDNYTPDTDSEEREEAPVLKARMFLRNVLGNVPARGDFDLQKVLNSTYFFS